MIGRPLDMGKAMDNTMKRQKKSKDINCTCGRKVAEKEESKVKIKCVKCKQIVEV
jgi:hypothetical protein